MASSTTQSLDISQLSTHDQVEVEKATRTNGSEEAQNKGSDDESINPPSEWSENSNTPKRHLGFWQIFSLIINSVVGTGIFTQPGYVLFLTKSKSVALALWGIGGMYTIVTMLVFVEYGVALPFNGGPMVYVSPHHTHGTFQR